MRRLLMIVGVLWVAAVIMASVVFYRQRDKSGFSKTGVAFMQKHCVECHGPEKQKKKLALHIFHNERDVLKQREVWEKVLQKVEFGEMPPEDPRPTPEERKAFVVL